MSGKETSMSLKFLNGCERLNAWDKDFLAFDSGNDSIKSAITWKAFEEGIGSIHRSYSPLPRQIHPQHLRSMPDRRKISPPRPSQDPENIRSPCGHRAPS